MGQSNTDTPRGVVLGDEAGTVYAESFNYLDETGTEYDGEQYILPDYAGGAAAGLVLYSNEAPSSEDTVDLIAETGVSKFVIIAADASGAKAAKKSKNYKKASKALSKIGIEAEVVSLDEQ